jgi:polar amino acid transport system substrate-binding protein
MSNIAFATFLPYTVMVGALFPTERRRIRRHIQREMRMNKIAIALSVCLLLSTAVGCASAITDTEKPFIVAMGLAYPPFETKDSAGNPSGVSVDFAKAFGEYIGREVRIENIAWDGLIPSLQTGKADMIVSSMTITEKRKEMVDFSDPYANALLAILANKNSGISYIDDLNQPGKKVAVKTGTTGDIYAQEYL